MNLEDIGMEAEAVAARLTHQSELYKTGMQRLEECLAQFGALAENLELLAEAYASVGDANRVRAVSEVSEQGRTVQWMLGSDRDRLTEASTQIEETYTQIKYFKRLLNALHE